MVEGDAVAEEFGEGGAGELLLFGREVERLGERDFAGELAGETFGIVAVRRENKDGAEAFAEGTGDAARPEALDRAREAGDEVVHLDFFERDRALVMGDDLDGAAEAAEPGGDIGGVGDGAGEEEQLQRRRGGEQRALVVVAAGGVGEPVILVDDEELKRGEIDGAHAGNVT